MQKWRSIKSKEAYIDFLKSHVIKYGKKAADPYFTLQFH